MEVRVNIPPVSRCLAVWLWAGKVCMLIHLACAHERPWTQPCHYSTLGTAYSNMRMHEGQCLPCNGQLAMLLAMCSSLHTLEAACNSFGPSWQLLQACCNIPGSIPISQERAQAYWHCNAAGTQSWALLSSSKVAASVAKVVHRPGQVTVSCQWYTLMCSLI